MAPIGQFRLYFGTYSSIGPVPRGRAEGIYTATFDPALGTLSEPQLVAVAPNPSYVAVHPTAAYLYACYELPAVDGKPAGAVGAYAIDPVTGGLTYLNEEPTNGEDPCHLVVDSSGRWVLAANYTSGSVAVIPIGSDGRVGPRSDFVQHSGASILKPRQTSPHAHSVNLDFRNAHALVADLGTDRLMVYDFDATAGKLRPSAQPWAQVSPGSGPRHLAFNPAGTVAYLINEIGCTLTVFGYDQTTGALSELQTLPTLPTGFAGRSHCADVNVLPTGRAVYGSNRGHDSLAVYSADPESGLVTLVGHTPTGGHTPRGFAVDPTGRFVIVANQDSDNVVVFAADPESGQLSRTGVEVAVPSPVCVKFVQR